MLKEFLQSALPPKMYIAGKRAWLTREARTLRSQCAHAADIGGVVDAVLASTRFRPDQKKVEITSLLRMLQASPPRRLCEIGGRVGGSLAMFAAVAAPDARIVSVDLEYQPGQTEALSAFARGQQHITCLAADSHASPTVATIRDLLHGEPLDFLLIDGDHSLQGATLDFEMYSPLVRPGGLIAFHDIVPDSKTRTGIDTGNYAGGVPILWNTLKKQGHRTSELIESPEQDGFGIGVLFWDGIRKGPS